MVASALFLLWLWLRSNVSNKNKQYLTIGVILILTTLFGLNYLTSSCVACSGQDTTCSCGGQTWHVVLQTGQTCSSFTDPTYLACKAQGCNAPGSGCGTGYTCQADGTCKSTSGTTSGICGTTKNSCVSGAFSDISDTTTYYRWKCATTTCTKAISTGGSTTPSSSDCKNDCLARGCTSYSVSSGSCVCSSCESPTSICEPGATDIFRCSSSGDVEQKYIRSDCSTYYKLYDNCNGYGCANKECKPKPADPNDPSISCGDGVCNGDENCITCHDDCSCSSDQTCLPTSSSADDRGCVQKTTPTPPAAPYCGDGKCDNGETCVVGDQGCSDCGSCEDLTYCGDGTCQSGEFKDTCPEDCDKPDNTWMWYALGGVFIVIAVLILFIRRGRLRR